MRPKPLDATPQLVNTRTLAERWGVTSRTVLRACRIHDIPEIRLCDGGRILFPCDCIRQLEKELFGRNSN